MKEKSEVSTRTFFEAVESYNILKKDADVKEDENAHLKKRVEDLEALLSA